MLLNKVVAVFVAGTSLITAFYLSVLDVSVKDIYFAPEKYKYLVVLIVLTWFVLLFLVIPFFGALLGLKGFKDKNYPFLLFRELPLVYKLNVLAIVLEVIIFIFLLTINISYYRLFLVLSIAHLIVMYSLYSKKRKQEFINQKYVSHKHFEY